MLNVGTLFDSYFTMNPANTVAPSCDNVIWDAYTNLAATTPMTTSTIIPAWSATWDYSVSTSVDTTASRTETIYVKGCP